MLTESKPNTEIWPQTKICSRISHSKCKQKNQPLLNKRYDFPALFHDTCDKYYDNSLMFGAVALDNSDILDTKFHWK